ASARRVSPAAARTVARLCRASRNALIAASSGVDHAGKPPIAAGAVEPWAAHMHELAALPNVAVKFSGLLTEAGDGQRDVAHLLPYAGPLLTEFGARRLMFGSDWPVCTLAADYGHTLSITAALLRTLDDAERAAVYGGTAIHWYGLAVGSGAAE
ncbi:amidohydrolase family protein, partial [Streptomyces olivaceoviridis]